MKNFFPLLLFMFLVNSSFSQKTVEGQLVTSKGDTSIVYMLTDHEFSNKNVLRYKKFKRTKIIDELSPKDVVNFSSDKFFLKVMPEVGNGENMLFYKVLLSGDGSLFSAINELGTITYYSLKEGEKLKEIPEDNYVHFLQENFQSCQTVNIRRKPYYEPYYLMNIIVSYNSCVNPKKYVYYKTRRQRDVYAGVGAGTGLLFFSLVEEPYLNSDNISLNYSVGGFINAEINRYLSLQIEGLYSNRSVNYEIGDFTGKYLLVPIIAQINFRSNDFQTGGFGNFYVNAGVIYGQLIQGSFERSGSEWDVLAASEARVITDKKSSFGTLVGVGAFLKTKKHLFKFEVRYDVISSKTKPVGFETGGNVDYRELTFKTSSLNLNVNYIIK